MQSLSVDFETRSTLDLRRTGIHKYAVHETTDIWCMAWALGDGDVQVWLPGQEPPQEIVDHVEVGGEMRAHNAQFERIIWREILGPRYGFPVPALEQWFCTAAEAAAMALPRSLKMLGSVLNLPERKDDDGHRLMLQMARPRSNKGGVIVWWDVPEKLEKLVAYCIQDVVVERAAAKRLRRLGTVERAVYLHDQQVNDRGVMLDIPLIQAANKIADKAVSKANAEVERLTGGAVDRITKVKDLTAWLQAQGLDVDNVRKSTVRDLLEEDDLLECEVRDVLTLRQDAGKSSTAKLAAMIRCVMEDMRARGLILYHGATTGRWTGKLIQPQNFPRPDVKDIEDLIPLVLAGDYEGIEAVAPPAVVIASMLRSMLRASPGCRFLSGDYAQIEMRGLGWVAGEPFNPNAYKIRASGIFGKPVADIEKGSFEYQVGKNTELGCGYQMGPDRFREQFKEQTGLDLPEGLERTAVSSYRADKPGIPLYWRALESAAMRAVREPGQVTFCGTGSGIVKYVVRGQFLWCILPSGRPLAYALPRIAERLTKFGPKVGLQYMGMSSYTRKWQTLHAYGGLLTENVVQALSRDILAAAMLRLERAGYPVVLSVHDEILCDVPNDHGSLEEFEAIMSAAPGWAKGLPVEVEGWEGERYRK